jgi:hypothetical protein
VLALHQCGHARANVVADAAYFVDGSTLRIFEGPVVPP